MSKYRVLSLLLMSAASCALASAASADPTVVRGIYPKVQQTAQPQTYNQPGAEAQDQSAPQMQTPAPVPASASSGSFGGGFLEMLFTGHAGSPQSSAEPSHERDMTALAGPMAPASVVNPERAQHEVDPMFRRQEVDYTGKEKPGTIVIDTRDKFLFLVEKGGKALRYGIGVGREGF